MSEKAKNGTVAYVLIPKPCDFHMSEVERTIQEKDLPKKEADLLRKGVPDAEYDLRTRHGFWANVCEAHREEHAMYPDELGIGKGQRLEPMRGPKA